MININISKEVDFTFRYKKLFNDIAEETMKVVKINKPSEANVIIVSNEQIREISKEYKKKDKATDVLSFPAEWKELEKLIGYNMLGDIFISYEKVKSQASEYGHSEKREWSYLFVHGLLHLCGYDHMNEADEKEMNKLANKVMTKLGIERG